MGGGGGGTERQGQRFKDKLMIVNIPSILDW